MVSTYHTGVVGNNTFIVDEIFWACYLALGISELAIKLVRFDSIRLFLWSFLKVEMYANIFGAQGGNLAAIIPKCNRKFCEKR